jgi:two-component system LytT family response regulator
MLRCIAVDDEAFATRLLASYIQKIPTLELVGTTTNPLEALQWVQEGRADLVFLDIQMPELTGLQFLKICGHRCKVVLTTAYPEYALEGYEHDVVDYLLKPIAFDRFLRAVQKAQALLKGESKNKYLKLNYADILYIQGLKNYVSIHVAGQRVVTYQTLRDLEAQLPQPPFVRVHKSYIISLDHLRMVEGNTLHVGHESITVGETYREDFFKLIREKG